jgi:hypothetical protein
MHEHAQSASLVSQHSPLRASCRALKPYMSVHAPRPNRRDCAAWQIECGFYCTQVLGVSLCASRCGDGYLASNEQCDLGGDLSEACLGCTIPIGERRGCVVCLDALCIQDESSTSLCKKTKKAGSH